MQRTTATQLERNEIISSVRVPLADKRHVTHKRMERWIRLQQFVYGLPEDYSYAVCVRETPGGRFETRSLVKVGWMCWFGEGQGLDKQHSIAVSLLNAVEAVSVNSTAVFMHKLKLVFRSRLRFLVRGERAGRISRREEYNRELLAG